MKVKICGLNPLRDVDLCLQLNVDFLGFIFYENSPRNLKFSDLNILNKYKKAKSFFTAVTVDANNEMIKNLIYMAKHYNIELLYLGANQDAILEANKFGLSETNAMNYNESSEGTTSAYRSAADAAKRMRTGKKIDFLDAERNASMS